MTLSMEVAEWLDRSLKETLEQTLSHRSTRLFAVNKTDKKFERTLVDADADPYELLKRLPKVDKVDAYALVMTGWMTPIDPDTGEALEDEDRIRVRLCAAVSDSGVSVRVRRWDGSKKGGESFEDGGEGAFPDALKLWWDATQGRNDIAELLDQ
jgi:hypothetical protein